MIVFDWDGTLCDSAHHIVASVQAACREMGLSEPSDEAAANIIGLGLPEGMARLFPEVPEQRRVELAQTYSRHFVANGAIAVWNWLLLPARVAGDWTGFLPK